jgi:hypothetical protein
MQNIAFNYFPSLSVYESLLLQENVQKVIIVTIFILFYFFAERKFLITKATIIIMQEKYQKQESMCPTKCKFLTTLNLEH